MAVPTSRRVIAADKEFVVNNEVNGRRLDILRLADVERKAVDWLWRPYIPTGKITTLDGDPESGKTYLSLAIAAHITTGRPLPPFGDLSFPSPPIEPRTVMFVSGEDDLGDTILPRFIDCGGDPTKFLAIRGTIEKTEDGEVQLGVTLDDIALIAAEVAQHRPALLVIDPFQAFVGAKVDFHRTNEVRPVMQSVARLAAEHDMSALLIRHLTKGNRDRSIYRGQGSVDVIAAARSALLAAANPQPPSLTESLAANDSGKLRSMDSRYVFVQIKSNLGQKGRAVAYSIHDGALNIDGTVDLDADDLLNPWTSSPSRKTAKDFLLEHLRLGPKASGDIHAAATQAGITQGTLHRAAKELAVQKKPSGFGEEWQWSLPVAVAPVSATEAAGTADSGASAASALAAADVTASPVTSE